MGLLGFVIGVFCLGCAYMNARTWLSDDDDKAGMLVLVLLLLAAINFGWLF